MLTYFRELIQSPLDWPWSGPVRKTCSGLLAALCLTTPITAIAQNGQGNSLPQQGYSLPNQGYSIPNQGYPLPNMAPPIQFQQQQFPPPIISQPPIQQVQNTPQSARAIHHLIEDMPQAQDEMEVIQQRSQLIVTRSPVTRVSIADPAIMEIVQYSPTEFSIVGLAQGSTTLTLWFENSNDRLIYTVRTIRDPNLDNQRRLDYGKLEKRLATLFPNSKVYLIPMSRKILVRGQARDANDAAHILAAIRGEIINQEGSLFGPQSFNGGGVNTGGYSGGVGLGGYGGGFGGGYGGVGYGGGAGLNAWDLAASFIINELQVPGEFQISLRVRVAELSRTAADHAGVNINVLFNDARNSLQTAVGAVSGGTLSGTFENGEIGIFLDWLCSNGTAKILAEPCATVLSGRNTRFLSGGEFAVPTIVGVGGAQGTTTSFRGFGTTITATPTVLDRDNIRIGVIAEYSNITSQNSVGGIPGLNTRRIQTVVEMREGQTMALAGLLSNRTTTQIQRIPLLGDIPHVGPLFFSSKTMTMEENELLILITPEIVRPMDAQEVPPVPGFDVTRPTHEEFWKYNMTEGRPDTGYYQSAPYGSGTTGTNVDTQHFNPGPAGSMYSPVPTNPGPGPAQGPVNTVPQMNGPQPYRQLAPVPQSAQRPSTQRSSRMQSSSQVIPTGSDVRQTNYTGPNGQPRRRLSADRQSNNNQNRQQQWSNGQPQQ